MTPDQDPPEAAALNRAMIARLAVDRDLSDPVADAIRRTPRHRFVPNGYFVAVPGSTPTAYRPLLPWEHPAEWLAGCYEDIALVTQVANTVAPGEVRGEILREPTSSVSEPGLVAFVLDEAGLSPGQRVLEIGAGAGWNAALLCELVGEDDVFTVEIDPSIAAQATTNLYGSERYPTVVVGDGREGYAPGAPYDRLIATCGVAGIYPAWLDQMKPGGIILAGLRGRLLSCGLVRLRVQDDGTAEGRFISGGNYMPARQEVPPRHLMLPDFDSGTERISTIGTSDLHDNAALVLADSVAPAFQWTRVGIDGRTPTDAYIDQDSGSFVVVTDRPDGTAVIREGGPDLMWARVEHAITTWRQAGRPAIEAFRVRVTPDGHAISMP
ncbi:ATP-grasp peptide maturase system methyltransferase [Yinghuangia sp. YIM S09857]|uniref:ATP-grasp peptide maturase system methyltransferase n=1 Tax=Yinghuangia sp. YIM S09857 TaxID=3436929 RepID=UPI003F52DBD5